MSTSVRGEGVMTLQVWTNKRLFVSGQTIPSQVRRLRQSGKNEIVNKSISIFLPSVIGGQRLQDNTGILWRRPRGDSAGVGGRSLTFSSLRGPAVSGFQHVTVTVFAGREPPLWFPATWKAAGHSCPCLTLLYQEINELLPKPQGELSCIFFFCTSHQEVERSGEGGRWSLAASMSHTLSLDSEEGNCPYWSNATPTDSQLNLKEF